MEASSDSATSTGAALKNPSIAGVAMKSPPNRYTQTEAVRALTNVASLPTTELVLSGG